MRLSTDASRDDDRALETVAAAARAGISVFDTAHAYGHGPAELGHNERLLARGLGPPGAAASSRVVTKGGMTRTGGRWIPDGRAKAIRADCEASLEALGGLPIDLYLVHAPDPRTPWRTSVRALARLADEGLVRHIGVSNVNRDQLDAALELAPVAAVQVALSLFDDRALRGGIVERCEQAGVAMIAHSPLGGPRRAGRLARHGAVATVADERGATPAEVALAWLLGLSPNVVAIPGARRPETARSAARAAALRLDSADRETLDRAFGRARPARVARRRTRIDADVVMVMGIPGAGKSLLAERFVGRGYLRLNRDERGGSLHALADALDEELSAGAQRVVLDNTYLTRALRGRVIETAARHGLTTRCVWLDTPLAQAQVNLVERLLGHFGALPTPEQLRRLARREPGVLTPTSQMRALRELEPPSTDEGLVDVERVSFTRAPPTPGSQPGVFVTASALRHPGWSHPLAPHHRHAPHLVFDWSPDGSPDELAEVAARLSAEVDGPVETAVCPHGAGPPVCWCRPPLPGLALEFSRAHGVDPSRSILAGTSPAHQTLATTLGARYVSV
jgi:aryl-alcohol dehydrogenase-like predicted oxidoreductase/predicted kinase